MDKIRFSNKEILSAKRQYRINLINSISGIKSVNLISTISQNGISNLAIFSSVIHLGSNPPLLGFVLRPETRRLSDTMQNIREMKYFTINHISSSQVKPAHQTSKKIDTNKSEFDEFGFKELFINNIKVPFVEDSKIKIGLNFLDQLKIKKNNTSLVIGEIDFIEINKCIIKNSGHIDLEKSHSIGVSGLDNYYYLTNLINLD